MSVYVVVGVPLTSVYENTVLETPEPRFNPKTGKPIAPEIVKKNQRKVMGLLLQDDEQEEKNPEEWGETFRIIQSKTRFELVNVDDTDYTRGCEYSNFAIGHKIEVEEGITKININEVVARIAQANAALREMGISHEAQLLVAYEKDYD